MGGLKGSTQREAFFARCDLTTMTQNDLNNGSLILVVGVAPLQPAEFIFLKITYRLKPQRSRPVSTGSSALSSHQRNHNSRLAALRASYGSLVL